jgi:uncharacterized membrane protein YebE (DUF533 family)
MRKTLRKIGIALGISTAILGAAAFAVVLGIGLGCAPEWARDRLEISSPMYEDVETWADEDTKPLIRRALADGMIDHAEHREIRDLYKSLHGPKADVIRKVAE